MKNGLRIQRLSHRVLQRAKTNPEQIASYLQTLMGTLGPELGEALIAKLPLPLADIGRDGLAMVVRKRAAEKAADQERMMQHQAAAKEAARAEATRIAALASQFGRLEGEDRILFLAGLPPADRNKIGTPADRRAAIALRRICIMTGEVRARLQCSRTELDRWDRDRRLPHLFTKEINIHRMTECRFWLPSHVTAALNHVEAWREQDKNRKIERRKQSRSAPAMVAGLGIWG